MGIFLKEILKKNLILKDNEKLKNDFMIENREYDIFTL
jgi:hypothetical protein